MGTIPILIIFHIVLFRNANGFLFMKNCYDLIINITMMNVRCFVCFSSFSFPPFQLVTTETLLSYIGLFCTFTAIECVNIHILSQQNLLKMCQYLVVHCTQNIRYDRSVGDLDAFYFWKIEYNFENERDRPNVLNSENIDLINNFEIDGIV